MQIRSATADLKNAESLEEGHAANGRSPKKKINDLTYKSSRFNCQSRHLRDH
jgi:hypothetical protein